MRSIHGFLESLKTRRAAWKRLLVVLAVNAVLFAAVTYRLANKQERLAGELDRLTFEVEQRKAELANVSETAERVSRNTDIVARFWSDTVRGRTPGLTEAWNEIDRLASETGVVRGRTGYDRELLDVGLERIQATMPVEGNYFDLVRFINRLERSERFFLVEEVKLSKRDVADAAIRLDCTLTFYLKPGAEETA